MRLDIVIPSYNEEENVEKLAKRILNAMESYDFELTFVNDGSQYKTEELVDKLALENVNITAIHHEKNKGYAEALKTGFEHGVSGGFDAVLLMDSDQSAYMGYPIQNMLDHSGNCEYSTMVFC